MRRSAVKHRRRTVREMVNDRALMAGFLFSAAVHAAFILWAPFSFDAIAPKKRNYMVAHLVRLPATAAAEAQEKTKPEAEGVTAAAVAAGKEAPAGPVAGEGPSPREGADVRARVSAAARGAKAAARYALNLAGEGGGALARAAATARPPAAGGRARLNIPRRRAAPGGSVDTLDQIRRMIDSQKTYPRIARRNGWEGRVVVEIRLAAGGALEDVQIVDASGYGVLDAATLKAVRRAGPFPPLEGKVQVPVTYRLAPL